jgi:hypothetical protein
MSRTATPLLAAFVLLSALAGPARAEVREVGGSDEALGAEPSCPYHCVAVARVTGFPVQTGSVKNPMRINEPGRVVAFSLKLGKPTQDQNTFFAGQFSAGSRVRLSVLRPLPGKRYRLLDQSAVVEVNTLFGSNPTFPLEKPLVVEKRNVVALTVITWVPAFATELDSTNSWRSTRPGNCDSSAEQGAQQKLRSVRTFACFQRTSRPLYSATFIPANRVTSDPAPANRKTRDRG